MNSGKTLATRLLSMVVLHMEIRRIREDIDLIRGIREEQQLKELQTEWQNRSIIVRRGKTQRSLILEPILLRWCCTYNNMIQLNQNCSSSTHPILMLRSYFYFTLQTRKIPIIEPQHGKSIRLQCLKLVIFPRRQHFSQAHPSSRLTTRTIQARCSHPAATCRIIVAFALRLAFTYV